MPLLLPLLLFGCIENWCARFNLQCEGTDLDVPQVVDSDLDGWAADDDCNDLNYNINPSAPEVCNRIDDDCDAEADEGMPPFARWYQDEDGDGYGGQGFVEGCIDQPADMSDNRDDCYDYDAAVSPGATEVCNGIDDNCDGLADDDDLALDLSSAILWFSDGDGDGYYGDNATSVQACRAPSDAGWATLDGDCDDTSHEINPARAEVCGNEIDDDCDGASGGAVWCTDLTTDDAAGSIYSADGASHFGAQVTSLPGAGAAATLVIAAPGGDDRGGAVHVGAPALDQRVAVAAFGVVWQGESESLTGSAIAALPDCFGPADHGLLIGARGGADGAGVVYLLDDPTNAGGALTYLTTQVDGSATGGVIGDQLAVGDLDGDGLLDAAVTAVSTEPGQGAVWLWPGVAPTQDAFDGGARVWASAAGVSTGRSTAIADIDGDGQLDLVLTEAEEDSDGAAVERIYLLTGPLVGDCTVDDANWRSNPFAGGERSDALVTVGGDHDGDGRADLLATSETYAGMSYGAVALYTDPAATTGESAGPAAVRIGGSDAAHLGADVGALPDFDGDGRDELVVAFPPLGPGVISLLMGPLTGVDTIAPGDLVMAGVSNSGHFGSLIATSIDLDGDGHPDLVGGQTPPADAPDAQEELFFFLLDY